MAYYGDPRELVVQYNEGTNGWSAPKRWPIDNGQLSPNALAAGDLNGDERTDLVLLGENVLYFLAQSKEHALGEPEKIPFSGELKSVQVLDIDGNQRADLLLVNWDNPNPFRFRLQNDAGKLGPEIYFTMIPLRSYWADDLDGDHRTEIVTIALNSGRAQIGDFVKQPSELAAGEFHLGQFKLLPLNKSSKAHRGLVWADVNRDGRSDLVVAEPDSGQLTLYLQRADGSISEGRTFPSFAGVSEIAVAGGSQAEPTAIYVLSPDERQIGLTHFDQDGHLPFPTSIPLDGKPLAMAVRSESPQGKPILAALVDRGGARFLLVRSVDGQVRTQKLSEDFKSNPSRWFGTTWIRMTSATWWC